MIRVWIWVFILSAITIPLWIVTQPIIWSFYERSDDVADTLLSGTGATRWAGIKGMVQAFGVWWGPVLEILYIIYGLAMSTRREAEGYE